jgi:transcriptional regulator of nitric oxide reductase
MENIKVPVSPGEVLDKITILEIKSERISDLEKVANVRVELALLQETWKEFIRDDEVIRDLHSQLKEVNEALWEIEDDIRDKERAKEFDQRFIELARAVYVTNDRRSRVKKELNLHLGSEIIEEKSYQDYQ